MSKILVFFSLLCGFLYSSLALSQNVVGELGDGSNDLGLSEIITEKIYKISASGRIFVLTNNSEVLIKGDFVSVLFSKDLVFRSIVAKVKKNYLGLKIVKIYSDDTLKKLRPGNLVQIIRGDDSYYRKKENEGEGYKGRIESDENLFDETLLEEDLAMEENTKRVIKQDNVVSLSFAYIEGVDTDGSVLRFGQFNGQWAYQFMDNVWAEIGFGQHKINDFPEEGLDTNVMNITFRIKYTFKGPFYTYFKPYLGYQMVKASDPSDLDTTQEQLDKEAVLLDRTEKNTVAIGITLLKRLVPGWFLRGNLGSDMMSIGFALEF